MDRALEWVRPNSEVADLVLKSYLGEIRERDEQAVVYQGIGWQELLYPETVQLLAPQVDGLRLAGRQIQPPGIERPEDLAKNMGNRGIALSKLGNIDEAHSCFDEAQK